METVLFLVPNVSVTFWSVFARPRDLGHCSQIQRWRQETCRFDAWPRQIYPTLEDTAPTQGLNFRSCIWAHKFYKCKTSQTALFGEPEEPTVFATCAILHPSCRWRPEVQWSCVLMGWKISGFEEDFDRFWQCFQTALKTRWATEPKSKTAHSTPFFKKILWCGQLCSARNRREIFTETLCALMVSGATIYHSMLCQLRLHSSSRYFC